MLRRRRYSAGLVSGVAWAGPLGALDPYLAASAQPHYEALRFANALGQRAAYAPSAGDRGRLATALVAVSGGDATALEAAAKHALAAGDDLGAAARAVAAAASDDAGRRAAQRLGDVALARGDADDALEAWAFELDVEVGDFDRALAKARATPEPERLPRLARKMAEAGRLDALVATAWTEAERAAVDAALERLARRDRCDDAAARAWLRGGGVSGPVDRAVDYYKCLYALRVKRGAFADAARAMLEAAAGAGRDRVQLHFNMPWTAVSGS